MPYPDDVPPLITGNLVVSSYPLNPFPLVHRGTRVLAAPFQLDAAGSGRDDTEGRTSPPSFRMSNGGSLRFRLAVTAAGLRSISVWAKQPDATLPRPVLWVLRNDAVGLLADLTTTASAGAGWVQLGPVTFTATATGGVVVELNSYSIGHVAECYWDDLAIT